MAKGRRLLTTSLKIGNQSTKLEYARDIVNAITQASMITTIEVYTKELNTYRKTLENAGNDEARRLIPFVTRQMMDNRSSTPGSGQPKAVEGVKPLSKRKWNIDKISTSDMERMADSLFTYNQTGRAPAGPGLEWHRLSWKWLKSKGFAQPYFIGKTGDLKRSLNAMRNYPVKELGGVKVKLKRRAKGYYKQFQSTALTKKFLLGEIEVKIFSKATAANFPGLASGRWAEGHNGERAPGLSPSVREKLSGPKVRGGFPHHRPMLTPAAQFWATYRIPLALKMAAQNIRKTPIGSKPRAL